MVPQLFAPVPGSAPTSRPTTFRFRDASRATSLPPTPNPDATPEQVLQSFLRAGLSADFVEAARWTIPRTLLFHGAAFHAARPWESSRDSLVLCRVANCWRVART